MSDFLKNVIKDVGNEYASLVVDGVEAGDVDSLLILVHIFSTDFYLVLFMVDLQQIRLLHWLERVQQVKLTFSWVLLKTFLTKTPMLV